jgi:hypothetical protein
MESNHSHKWHLRLQAIARMGAALERATCKVMCHFMIWMEEGGGHDIIPVLTKLRSKDK